MPVPTDFRDQAPIRISPAQRTSRLYFDLYGSLRTSDLRLKKKYNRRRTQASWRRGRFSDLMCDRHDRRNASVAEMYKGDDTLSMTGRTC